MLKVLVLVVLSITFAVSWRLFSHMKPIRRLALSASPLFLFVGLLSEAATSNMVRKVAAFRDEKKFYTDLPLFIDNLRACLKAGLCLDDALSYTLQKRKWARLIHATLSDILALRNSGATMVESLERVKDGLGHAFGGRFLRVLLISLLIGFTTGGDLTLLLDKAQVKIQTSLELQRKMRVFTAQMKMQTLVIALAPVGIGALLVFLDPERVMFFVNSVLGVFLFVMMIILYSIGLRLLSKIGSLDA